MNPFAQLVSPQSLIEAVAASVELKQLPGRAYRPLDSHHGPWTLRPDAELHRDESPETPPQR